MLKAPIGNNISLSIESFKKRFKTNKTTITISVLNAILSLRFIAVKFRVREILALLFYWFLHI